MKVDNFGVWSITLPAKNGKFAIDHNTKVKISLTIPGGEVLDRLPAWSKRVVQNLDVSPVYDSVFWNPPKPYVWKNKSPQKPEAVKVYEAHVGISSPEGKVGTYKEYSAS